MEPLWNFLRQQAAPIRIALFLVALVVLAAPIALPLYWWEYQQPEGHSVILAPVSLVFVFAALLFVWAQRVHGLKQPWQVLGFWGGLRWWRTWVQGFAIGAAGVALLYGLQLAWGWGDLTLTTISYGRIILEGLFLALLVGIAEEFIFRGWLLFELDQDYSPALALWINGFLFAIAHYIRPVSAIVETWPQFLGLWLLGLTLVWARRTPVRLEAEIEAQRKNQRQHQRSRTSLANAAGLHGGLVWAYYQVTVAGLVTPTGAVPPWISGIQGNPLAGVMGAGLLGGIAAIFYYRSHTATPPTQPQSR
ncbi:MAG: type II CAAX endopeptidase family protein [Cyanobacteria bacterium]|nr:type II CAAX endopeptidase family protein [Cyanobacteriota bacterium]